jgi:hypothetical protein
MVRLESEVDLDEVETALPIIQEVLHFDRDYELLARVSTLRSRHIRVTA